MVEATLPTVLGQQIFGRVFQWKNSDSHSMASRWCTPLRVLQQ